MDNMGEIDVPAELESRVAPETAGGQPLNLQQANVNFAEGPTPEEQALMQQQGGQMEPEMQEQMTGQQEMPMEEMGQEQPMEESPNDMKRRMIEQYLQQAQ
jgi:hypothetical protein